jgi:hypothetical protein
MKQLSNHFKELSENVQEESLKTLLQYFSIIVNCEDAMLDAVEALEPIVAFLVVSTQIVMVNEGKASGAELNELIFKLFPASGAAIVSSQIEENHPGIFEKEN